MATDYCLLFGFCVIETITLRLKTGREDEKLVKGFSFFQRQLLLIQTIRRGKARAKTQQFLITFFLLKIDYLPPRSTGPTASSCRCLHSFLSLFVDSTEARKLNTRRSDGVPVCSPNQNLFVFAFLHASPPKFCLRLCFKIIHSFL